MPTFLAVLFIVVCVLLILVVLLQRGRGGGLGSAFGGGTSSAFGTRTGDVFTWVTIVLTGLFLLLAVVTTLVYRPATGVVMAPQFMPSAGEITEPTKVAIVCQTESAKIYYTVDGSDPTERSELYGPRGQITVKPGTTVRARAYRQGFKPSEVAGAYYGPKPASMPGEGLLPGPMSMPASGPFSAPASAPISAPASAAAPT